MTLFTSDKRKSQLLKYAFLYILITLFCVIFGAVYELFSHGVYSYKMIYAFAAPLVLGAVPLLCMAMWAKHLPDGMTLTLWNCGVAALATGLLLHGVLEIYGTTSHWIIVYYIIASLFIFAGLALYLVNNYRSSSHYIQRGIT